jgi:hypothetical protein
VSKDGLIWSKGVGAYGEGWNYTGTGIVARVGETIYVKYFASTPDSALHFADHGRKWGEWRAMGPALIDNIGISPLEPVILRISNVGTPGSTVAWINGPGKSGIWSGLLAPGPYDLALHAGARWSLPPIVVTDAPKPQSFWSRLAGFFKPDPPRPGGGDEIRTVPDNGVTAVLLACAWFALVLGHRARS